MSTNQATESTYQLPVIAKKGKVVFHVTIPDDLFTRAYVIPYRWFRHGGKSDYACSRLGSYGVSKTYLHRLLFIIYHGDIPDRTVIDHADRNPKNNMPSNLRAVSHSANIVNSSRHGVSGYRGVRKCRGRWQARITKSGQTFYLGCYDTKEEAAAARQKAEQNIYPELHAAPHIAFQTTSS